MNGILALVKFDRNFYPGFLFPDAKVSYVGDEMKNRVRKLDCGEGGRANGLRWNGNRILITSSLRILQNTSDMLDNGFINMKMEYWGVKLGHQTVGRFSCE